MEELTKRQKEVLKFVADYSARQGFAPTVREVAAAMKIAIKGAQDHLAALQRKGYIERKSRRPRTIQVTAGPLSGRIPVLGRIAAGRPIDAVENFEGTVGAPAELFGRGDLFALEVRGDSMIGDHIVEGDLAIIRKQPRVENGQIAAVAVEGEVTLKRFHQRGATVELRPSNPAHKPIVAPASEVRVAGLMVGLLRK
jgi:repressor LexA